MVRKTLRVMAWATGSVLLLGVAAWAVVLAINWRDREPSEAATRLANAYRERPAVPDESNAFVYVMGFGVRPEESPRDMGLKRVAWMQQVPVDPRRDPLGDQADIRHARHATIVAFIAACSPDSSRCADAFSTAGEVFERWIASEPWLLDRYRTLIAHAGWRESVPFDVRAPLPAYALVMDGQRLFLLNAGALARRGDTAAVREMLASDVRFWREVLRSSDILISKMIATVALNRHFEQGHLVLREFPADKAVLAMPAEWAVPLSDAERSLTRTITGEWVFSSAALKGRPGAHFWAEGDWMSGEEPPVRAKVLAWVMGPLYQPQDSINAFAAYYADVASALEAPLRNYESALEKVSAINERWERDLGESRSPYNITGKRFMAASGAPDFGPYARRVNDIEGVRLAALAAMTLRERKVQPQEVAAALQTLPFRNPYNDQPLTWDADSHSILFTGLERAARGTHRIRY